MLGKNKPVTFIPSKDSKKSKTFYQKTLGLRFVSADGFAHEYSANGIRLRVVNVPDYRPMPFTILGWESRDIRKTVKGLQKKGVKFLRYDFMEQDEVGIWHAPSGAQVAWFKDPDGNVLSISQH